MPPVAKTAQKRKAETEASEEFEEPPPTLTAEQLAMRAFMGVAAEPTPAAKYSSGGAAACAAEVVVLSNKLIKVAGKGGQVPKSQITGAVLKVMGGGCKDLIATGVEGVNFLLPTKQLEASPEEIAANKDAKGPTVLDVDPNSKVAFLSTFSASFYIEAAGAAPKPGVVSVSPEACTPGTKVLITGISAGFGKNGGTRLFSNARKISPISEPKAPHEAAAALIAEARSPAAQAAAVTLLSCCFKGFFENAQADAALQQQADSVKLKWQQVVNGAATRCETLAMSLAGDAAQEQAAAALTGHAERIKAIDPAAAAAGDAIFLSDIGKDELTPYVAPIVQVGAKPGYEITDFCAALFDPERRDRLPSSFVEGKVKSVDVNGNLIRVVFKIFIVADRAAAVAAIAEGSSPVLTSTTAAACVKFSKKSAGQELFGTANSVKFDFAVKETLPYADMAVWASIYPRGAEDVQLDGHFVNTNGIDMAGGIAKVGAAVSMEWLDKSMLSGRGVFIHSAPDGVQLIDVSDKAGPPPTLSKNGYQALSESSFDFDSLKSPPGKTRKFVVLYSGVSKNVAASPSIATDTEAGQAHLEEIVTAAREDADLKSFLREDALVYCVAV